MDRKIYNRGILGQCWYNFTEALVYGLVYRPTPKELIYNKKIKYGEGKLQYINTYNPKNTYGKRPLLIYIHGGSWVSGITEMRNSYISQWAKKGFFTAAVSYSYAPQKIFPYQLQEMFTAIDFILDHAEEYNIDTDKIVLAGESAGGYFISYAASVVTDKTILDKLGIKFKHRDNFAVKALVSISGCYDLQRLSDKQKPQADFPDLKTMITSYLGKDYDSAVKDINSEDGYKFSPKVNEGYPPSFLIWADKDKLRYETFDFSEELKTFNIPHELYKADGIIGMHAWPIVVLFKKSRICFEKTYSFVTEMIK